MSTIGKAHFAAAATHRSNASFRVVGPRTTARGARGPKGGNGSVERLEHGALQVDRLGNIDDAWMVERLRAQFAKGQSSTGVGGGRAQHVAEQGDRWGEGAAE